MEKRLSQATHGANCISCVCKASRCDDLRLAIAPVMPDAQSLVNQATDRSTVYIFGEGDAELANIVFLFFGCGWNVGLLDGREFRCWWIFRRFSHGIGNVDGGATFRTVNCLASQIRFSLQFGRGKQIFAVDLAVLEQCREIVLGNVGPRFLASVFAGIGSCRPIPARLWAVGDGVARNTAGQSAS